MLVAVRFFYILNGDRSVNLSLGAFLISAQSVYPATIFTTIPAESLLEILQKYI
jgi:hypothetical protein